MDILIMITAIEAQFVMGHWLPSPHMSMDRKTITHWSWDEDLVRQQLHVPLDDVWGQRVLELEAAGLASFTVFTAPVTYDEQGNETGEIPGWRDEPREKYGDIGIDGRGVLRLAALYGRPYVKYEESPALLAHWQLVHAIADARMREPYDEEKWKREWPERWQAFQDSQARLDESNSDE